QLAGLRNLPVQPRVLIVSPLDPTTLAPALQRLMERKTFVIALDRNLPEGSFTTCIKCNQQAAGAMGPECLVKKLTERYAAPKGVVLELGDAKDPVDQERQVGIHKVLDKYRDIKVISGEMSAQDANKAAAAKLFADHPQLDAVLG